MTAENILYHIWGAGAVTLAINALLSIRVSMNEKEGTEYQRTIRALRMITRYWNLVLAVILSAIGMALMAIFTSRGQYLNMSIHLVGSFCWLFHSKVIYSNIQKRKAARKIS